MNDTALVLRNDKGNVTGFVLRDPKTDELEIISIYGERIAFSAAHYAEIGEWIGIAPQHAVPQPSVPKDLLRQASDAAILASTYYVRMHSDGDITLDERNDRVRKYNELSNKLDALLNSQPQDDA